MSSIKLVQGDNLPIVTLTLTDAQTGNPIDVSASTTTVVVKLRASTGTTILSTLTCTKTNGGADGYLSVNYGAAALVAAVQLAKVVEELRAEIARLKIKVGE